MYNYEKKGEYMKNEVKNLISAKIKTDKTKKSINDVYCSFLALGLKNINSLLPEEKEAIDKLVKDSLSRQDYNYFGMVDKYNIVATMKENLREIGWTMRGSDSQIRLYFKIREKYEKLALDYIKSEMKGFANFKQTSDSIIIKPTIV